MDASTFFDRAKKAEGEGDPFAAISAYESAIREENPPLEAYINLAVICYLGVEREYMSKDSGDGNAPLSIDDLWLLAMRTLDLASERHGDHPEIDFWRRYFRFSVLGDPHFVDEAKESIASGLTTVPFFYLYMASEGKQYYTEVNDLKRTLKKEETFKSRYILSMLQW